MSNATRERLSNVVAKQDSSIEPKDLMYMTFTIGENTGIRGREYKRHLKNITQAIIREYGGFGMWRYELEKDNTALMHLCIASKGMDLDIVDEKKQEVKI